MPIHNVRDPVHGFIPYGDWELGIINHPAFQRLRRIRQLALTDFVYPGATHTRFEHALGTMHVATQMFDSIVLRQENYLKTQRGYDDSGLRRDRQIVKLAALLHDIGHSPFSHSGETLFPTHADSESRYHHEEYSARIIATVFQDAIENHPGNANYEIKAIDVADLITGTTSTRSNASVRRLIWRPLVTSQLDADRCDYLLRDSLHAGVSYGKYDLDRILTTLSLGLDESDDPVVAIELGGWHAAEGLIIARYMMFTQVYFHHTRLALDHHVEQTLSYVLTQEYGRPEFPPPDDANLEEYLKWDDWVMFGRIAQGAAGEHGEFIRNRELFRSVYNTTETPTDVENQTFDSLVESLGDLVGGVSDASKSWYSLDDQDLQIVPDNAPVPRQGRPLSAYSTIVRNMRPVAQRRIFVKPSDRAAAQSILNQHEAR